jgi:hypothetical protein
MYIFLRGEVAFMAVSFSDEILFLMFFGKIAVYSLNLVTYIISFYVCEGYANIRPPYFDKL